MKTLICIPAFNAAPYLPRLIAQLKDLSLPCECLVIDDGSTDQTSDVCRNHAIPVMAHEINRGKGAALQTGIRHALKTNMDVLVTLDADLQHPVHRIPALLEPIQKNVADFVIGARTRSHSGMSWARRFSNATTSRLVSWRIGRPISDSQSGFRAIRTEFLKNLDLRTSRYETETEILIHCADHGTRFAEIDIPTIYGDAHSSIRHIADTFRFIRLYIRLLGKQKSRT